MRGGLVQQVSDPQVLHDFRGDLFVAHFICSREMNLLPAQVLP